MSNSAVKLWQTVVCKNGAVAAWHPSVPFPYRVPSLKMGLLSSPIFNKIGNSKNEENKQIDFNDKNKLIE
uniref:Uncharacterized protein n=1 Tax=Meloidogyne hapla TaxID=6305 RepID=A0A1I8B2I8_MELHA